LYLLGEKENFSLYGSDFSTPDGTAVRDYVHVTDLAKAHVLALNKLPTLEKSQFINLGTNEGFSVLEVIKKVEATTGQNVSYSVKPRRKGDVDVLLASREKAKKFLGWELDHSDLETIIQTAWDWHKKSRA
jgi:UDP-glucose 4-epimerase